MAKGGSSNQPVKQEVTQSNLPEYARPYFEGMMQRASTALSQPYQRYVNAQGQPIGRIAGFTDQQTQLQDEIMGQQAPSEFGQASGLASTAGQRSLDFANYDTGQFNADQVRAGPLNYFQMQGPDSFTQSGMTQQYMSPYMQAALEPQRREALRAAQQGQLAQGLGSARQGAYGGSRQLLASMERERNLGQNLADIQARGMQTAFEQAQGQFNTEQQARQAAARTNLEAALGVQSLGSEQGMRAALANQQQNLEAQRMREQSRQFGSTQGLAALAQAGQMGQTLSNIGSARSQADIARFGLQQSTAAQRQALNQQKLDMAYQDFLRERDYPMEQLQQYSSLLRGVPITPSSTTSTYAQQPGIGQQLLGTGLGAASIYKTFAGA
jgi:hypothetical protein